MTQAGLPIRDEAGTDVANPPGEDFRGGFPARTSGFLCREPGQEIGCRRLL